MRSSSGARSAGAGQLDAHQGRAGLPVVPLDVLEQGDVVVRPEHLVEEPPQRARLLGELDEEVVLEALVDERALDDLGVAADVVVAPGQHAHDRRARARVELRSRAAVASAPAGSAMMPSAGRARASRADLAFVDGDDSAAQARTIVEGPSPTRAHGGAVDEAVELARGRPGPPAVERGRHAGRPCRLHADDAGRERARPSQASDAGEQPAAADGDDDASGGPPSWLDDLACHRALAGDRAGVVEGRDEHGAGLPAYAGRRCGRLVVGVAVDRPRQDRRRGRRSARRFWRGVVRGR